MIYTILIEWGKELSLFLFIAAAFLFSFLARITIFRELDYYEIKYTPKTKQRTLWLIFFNLLTVSLWLHILQRLFSRL
jgi:hypothetical protein